MIITTNRNYGLNSALLAALCFVAFFLTYIVTSVFLPSIHKTFYQFVVVKVVTFTLLSFYIVIREWSLYNSTKNITIKSNIKDLCCRIFKSDSILYIVKRKNRLSEIYVNEQVLTSNGEEYVNKITHRLASLTNKDLLLIYISKYIRLVLSVFLYLTVFIISTLDIISANRPVLRILVLFIIIALCAIYAYLTEKFITNRFHKILKNRKLDFIKVYGF